MDKFLLIVTAYCGLVTSVVAQIKTNPLPAASLSMFQSSKNAPHEFEIQAAGSTPMAAATGSMVFGQGKANISKNGTVSGEMNLTNFANNSSQSSVRKSVPFSGKISNPRKVWEKTHTREDEIDQQADYLVDFTGKTTAAPYYTFKGVLVYRHRIEYWKDEEYSSVQQSNGSYIEPRVCIWGPNGEVGFTFNRPY